VKELDDGAMYFKLSGLLLCTFLNITRKLRATSVTTREVIDVAQRLFEQICPFFSTSYTSVF